MAVEKNNFINITSYMIYPPKKRAYSPEPIVTKDLSHLINISSKFTGSGGSICGSIQIPPLWLLKSSSLCPRQWYPESSGKKSNSQYDAGSSCQSPHCLENTMTGEISPSQSASSEPPARYTPTKPAHLETGARTPRLPPLSAYFLLGTQVD